MSSGVFIGGSVLAAVIAGAIALFAPCCISVMLPAYFAGSFQNRRLLIAMTFLFAAGIATVILPLAMGASILQHLFVDGHRPIYLAGGALMLALSAYTLLGGRLHLLAPGRQAGSKAGPVSVYSLGLFSGIASSCCAPVLAGVLALAGAVSSFGMALGLGLAYVLGMVAPLFVISLLWEWIDWRSSRLFRPRSSDWHLGPLRRTLGATGFASGLLLALMGIATLWIGMASGSMPSPSGWQETIAARLQHYGHLLTGALWWLPFWGVFGLLAAWVLFLTWRAVREADSMLERAAGEAEERDGEEKVLEQPHA